jgi:hypothetical protein
MVRPQGLAFGVPDIAAATRADHLAEPWATRSAFEFDAGPRADWALAYVSAYASAHPWEDWAETCAHYLHMIDALDTALSFGVGARAIESTFEHFDAQALSIPSTPATSAAATAFLAFVNAWVELATALNELSRSMGQPDFYRFVLSNTAVRKLHFIHRVVSDRRGARARPAKVPRGPGTRVASAVAH